VATRRVESAICAFGGSLNSKSNRNRESVGDTGVSWAPEENASTLCSNESPNLELKPHARPDKYDPTNPIDERPHDHPSNSSRTGSHSSGDSASNDPTKLKYRCKRCGQLKQNHLCPYQQPLQRSIGIMVYPAVNSYNAAEPGVIAPSLSKMNNFISYDDSDQGGDPPSDHVTQRRPMIDDGSPFASHSMTVTPESLRGAFRAETELHSPQSSLSAQSSDDPMSHHLGGLQQYNASSKLDGRRILKRSHGQLTEPSTSLRQCELIRNPPFVTSVSLRPEQYRAVTPSTKDRIAKPAIAISSVTERGPVSEDILTAPMSAIKMEYRYPPVPLSFAERKRMSDTLFYLSQEIPTVTGDCATILRTARHKNDWDVAIAELLTQVVVALYCGEGDLRLDGLQRYLLSLGISC
jgi:hypothetical protein